MGNEKVSIIVPVYKVEEYLESCVNSIIAQTYSNIEIILVDDGSPDKCPEICEALKKKDKRIKVIHKQNGGLSDARNFGVKAACGEYVLYVDSDDVIEADMVEHLVKLIHDNNADIALSFFDNVLQGASSLTLKANSVIKLLVVRNGDYNSFYCLCNNNL